MYYMGSQSVNRKGIVVPSRSSRRRRRRRRGSVVSLSLFPFVFFFFFLFKDNTHASYGTDDLDIEIPIFNFITG